MQAIPGQKTATLILPPRIVSSLICILCGTSKIGNSQGLALENQKSPCEKRGLFFYIKYGIKKVPKSTLFGTFIFFLFLGFLYPSITLIGPFSENLTPFLKKFFEFQKVYFLDTKSGKLVESLWKTHLTGERRLLCYPYK